MTRRFAAVLACLMWIPPVAGAQIRTPIATAPRSAPTPGPAPNNANAVATSPTTATVTWDAPAGVRGYLVQRRRDDNPSCCTAQSGPIAAASWSDGGLESGATYTYSITVMYTDGRSGSTEVQVTPPIPSVAVPMNVARAAARLAQAPCTPTNAAGPQPVLELRFQTPGSASLQWNPVADQYTVFRAPEGTTQWTVVGSTCGGPSPVQRIQYSDGTVKYQVDDLSGGVNGPQVYRVTAIGRGGETGWNTLHWTPPCYNGPVVHTPVVSGSTVTLTWENALPCNPGVTGGSAASWTIRSSYGYVNTKSFGATRQNIIYGVPLGAHTFTVSQNWRPDVSKMSRPVPVTIQY